MYFIKYKYDYTISLDTEGCHVGWRNSFTLGSYITNQDKNHRFHHFRDRINNGSQNKFSWKLLFASNRRNKSTFRLLLSFRLSQPFVVFNQWTITLLFHVVNYFNFPINLSDEKQWFCTIITLVQTVYQNRHIWKYRLFFRHEFDQTQPTKIHKNKWKLNKYQLYTIVLYTYMLNPDNYKWRSRVTYIHLNLC